MERKISDYLNIINMPRHVSSRRARMSSKNRAAQFAPFAALSGYEAYIEEAARRKEERVEPAEDLKTEINNMLQYINRHINERPRILVRYFFAREQKYMDLRGRVKHFDTDKKTLFFENGTIVFLEDILYIRILG